MPHSQDTAYDEPRTSGLFELLKAVEIVGVTKEASSSRRDTPHETSDSQCLVAHDQELVQCRRKPLTTQRLVAHDQELVQCRRKPPTSVLMHLLKAVEVVHEMKDAAPGLHNTLHETSDSHLVAHDNVLVQSRRKPHTGLRTQPLAPGRRGTRHGTSSSRRSVASGHTMLNAEEPEGAESGGDFAGLCAHPLSVQTKEATEAKEGTAPTSKSDGDENAPVLERKCSSDVFSGKPASKASSKDALRGRPSYCGWSYAFA